METIINDGVDEDIVHKNSYSNFNGGDYEKEIVDTYIDMSIVKLYNI